MESSVEIADEDDEEDESKVSTLRPSRREAARERLRDEKGDADEEGAREEDENDGARASPVVDVARLLAECVRRNLRCLAFCKTRKLCELVLMYAREMLR